MECGIRRKPIPYITPTIAAARKAKVAASVLSSVFAIIHTLQVGHRWNTEVYDGRRQLPHTKEVTLEGRSEVPVSV